MHLRWQGSFTKVEVSSDDRNSGDNNDKFRIHISTSRGGQKFLVSGKPTHSVSIVFVGGLEFDDFLEAIHAVAENEESLRGLRL